MRAERMKWTNLKGTIQKVLKGQEIKSSIMEEVSSLALTY